MEESHYEVVIVGGGQAGVPLAFALAEAGFKVALAERKYLGGSCVNYGCKPSKAAIESARVAHQARRAAEYGLKIPSVSADFPAVLDRARKIVMDSRESLDRQFEDSANPRLLRGHARFEGRAGEAFRLRVGDRAVTADRVVLDTGARSRIPDLPGLEEIDYLSGSNWLDRPELPEHLVFLGGGVISLEMSQFYRRMGSRVTVINRSKRVAGREDEDVSTAMQHALEAEGIEFRNSTRVKRVERSPRGIALALEANGGAETLAASHLFIAIGRQPNTADLGLETVGVKVPDSGIVEVDRRLETSVKGIWAAGDIRGGLMLTNTSWDDYRILGSQLAGDGSRTTDRIVPYAIFTDPELGRVGMTETEARKSGRRIKVSRFEMTENGKAEELGETRGFIKAIADAETDRLLGATVFCVHGSELVHLYAGLMMSAGSPYTLLRDAIQIHPTLAEGLQSAVKALDDAAVS